MCSKLIKKAIETEGTNEQALFKFRILLDLCIPMRRFETCVYTAFKCHPNGCELRKKLIISFTEITKASAAKHVYIDLIKEKMTNDDDDDDEEEYRSKQVPKSKQKSTLDSTVPDKKFDDPKVNIARIPNHGATESSKRGRELYEHLKALYDSTKYGDGSVKSMCYKLTHTDIEMYFGGSEARMDSEYYIPFFGSIRIPIHFMKIRNTLNGRNVSYFNSMYIKLIESIDSETYPNNVECIVLRNMKIPPPIAEACMHSALKDRPNGAEIRKRLCIGRSELVSDPDAIDILQTL